MAPIFIPPVLFFIVMQIMMRISIMTIRKSTPATDNATTLISEEKKDSGIESVGVVVGSDARDDCMTAEVKAEDKEVKAEDD